MMSEVIIKNLASFGSQGLNVLDRVSNVLSDKKHYGIMTGVNDGTNMSVFICELVDVKPNTEYTIIIDILNNKIKGGVSSGVHLQSIKGYASANIHLIGINDYGIKKYKFTTKSNFSDSPFKFRLDSWDNAPHGIYDGRVEFRFMVLEGDWTDLELPSYFEGERVYNWQEPRLDWTTESYLNLEDMNRIEGNFDWLRWEMNSYFSKVTDNLNVADYKRQLAQIDFYTTFNRVENNINSLKDRYFQHSQWINLPESYTDEYNIISYQNIYRLEKDLKLLYDLWQGMKSTWTYPGEIYCGEWGEY